MPIKYMCDICGAEAQNTVNEIITSVEKLDKRLVLKVAPQWQTIGLKDEPYIFETTAYICNHCIKGAITKERL